MSNEVIGVLGVVLLLILMFIRMPLGPAMAAAGFFGLLYLGGWQQASYFLRSGPYAIASTYLLTTTPLFILMGIFAAYAGLSEDGFYTANKWLGHLPGGLAMATVGGCAAFAAVCGAAVATAVTMCKVALPEMRKYNYSDQFSLGTISCGGLLGFMIPPSIPFIIYAYLTEVSIGQLFVAGILPGILITVLFIITIYVSCQLNPKLAARGPRASWRERVASLNRVWGVIVLFLLVLGGMYGGIFTPTEGGAVGAFGALILGLAKRRLTRNVFVAALLETASLTGMIFILIMGAQVLSSFVAKADLPFALANFVNTLQLPPVIIMTVILIMYLAVGFFLDIIPVIVITIPIIYPIIVNFGIDPVWFGVLTVLMIMVGNVSPPFGIVVFSIGGLVREVHLQTIFRGVWPYLYAMVIAMVILIIFPQISLWLPSMMVPK